MTWLLWFTIAVGLAGLCLAADALLDLWREHRRNPGLSGVTGVATAAPPPSGDQTGRTPQQPSAPAQIGPAPSPEG